MAGKSISVIACIILLSGCIAHHEEVKLFRVFELTIQADNPGSIPYVNGPGVYADFRGISGEAAGREIRAEGFWDGDNVWKIRFSPDRAGEWRYKSVSPDKGLDGKKGKLTAIAPSAKDYESNFLLHGFLEVEKPYSFRLSDGTPFFPVGDTQWSFSEEFSTLEWKQWIDAISSCGYNSFLGCVWLGKYTRFSMDPFADKDPATGILDVSYFREKLDSMVSYANDKGIIMGLVIGGFPDNSQWFRKFSTIESNDRWFRYIVARYAAYNVRWGLFGEMDEATGRNSLEDKDWQWVGKHYAELIKSYDPYRHPVGSHNTRVDTILATFPEIDYIIVQEGSRLAQDQYKNAMNQRKWNKPVCYEEYWYEMDGDQDAGIANTHRNFIHAMAFPTMGSLMRNHKLPEYLFPPDEAAKEGLSLHDYLMKSDTGIARMKYFTGFYRVLTDKLDSFVPAGNLVDRGFCSQFGNSFAVFVPGGGSFSIDLNGISGTYDVKTLDIKGGGITDTGPVHGGSRALIETGLQSDAAVILIRQE